MEKQYSKRELDEKFDDILSFLGRIEEQTTKHNGRMSKLETFQAYVAGASAVIIIMLVPLLGWVLWKVSTLDIAIQEAVQTALIPYTK